MIDLHSHLLPGVDDGSRSVEQSVRVLSELMALGLTDVCLTPHLVASKAGDGIPLAHDRAFDALSAAAPAGVRLHRGAEVMLDRPLTPEAAANPAIRLGGTRYILVEFSRIVPVSTVESALRTVSELGLVPLLAHPERYSSCSVASAKRWRATGALLQVDATTLFAAQTRGERARALVAAGMADILAADNHGDDRSLAMARTLLTEQDGAEQAELLTEKNPRAILADADVQAVEPFTVRLSWTSRLRRLFDAGEGL
jgi:protein-tyrosine phosphatase